MRFSYVCSDEREHLSDSLNGRTTKITRLPPRDFDFKKRPIGNSGAFFLFVDGERHALVNRRVQVCHFRISVRWTSPELASM